MLYGLFKFYTRIAFQVYCRRVVINKPELLDAKGPLLLAANHPNSFLDGIIMTTLFRHPVYSLARGDAFAKPLFARFLRSIRLLPVYRTSEGVENLNHNYTTFAACENVFRKNAIVIIFSEGRCINEWKLRPLRKGTARLATGSWKKGIPLQVIPVAFNYNPFRNFGKNVFIQFGTPLDTSAIMGEETEGKQLLQFNEQLQAQLKELVFEIEPADHKAIRKQLTVQIPLLQKIILAIPAAIGWILHAPLYFAAKAFTYTFFDNDHFDSVMVSSIVLVYPLYLLIFLLIAVNIWGWWAAAIVLVLLPFTAWACIQLKPQA